MIDDNLDGLFLGIFELPVRSLEELPRLARHDFDVLGAEAKRRSAAIHGRVTDADDQHILANAVDVLEGDGLEPRDSDVNILAVVTAGNVEILALRRAGTDEDRIVALIEELAHALDRRTQS